MMPGAVKGRQPLSREYAEIIERLPPQDAAVIRKYVAQLNEEAGFWRIRFRATQKPKGANQ